MVIGSISDVISENGQQVRSAIRGIIFGIWITPAAGLDAWGGYALYQRQNYLWPVAVGGGLITLRLFYRLCRLWLCSRSPQHDA